MAAAAQPGLKLWQPSEVKLTIGFYQKLQPDNYGILTALDYHQSGLLKALLREGVSRSTQDGLEVMSLQVPPSASEHPVHESWIPELSKYPQDIPVIALIYQ